MMAHITTDAIIDEKILQSKRSDAKEPTNL